MKIIEAFHKPDESGPHFVDTVTDTLPPNILTTALAELSRSINTADVELIFDYIRRNQPRYASPTTENATSPAAVKSANEFIQYVVDTGIMAKYIQIIARRYPHVDEHEVEHIAYMATWRAYLSYPWNEEFDPHKFFNYVYTGIIHMASHVSFNDTSELDHERVLHSTVSPEHTVIQEDTVLDYINEIVYLSAQKTDQQRILHKIELLKLLADGASIAEIADTFGIAPASVQQMIVKFQSIDPNALQSPVDTSGRVAVNAGGQWIWNAHTAQAILSSASVKYLNTAERTYLEQLASGKSHKEVKTAVSATTHDIQVKLRTHGTQSSRSEKTYHARRTELLIWLQSVNPQNDKEQQIIDALISADGNTDEATRMLGASTRGVVTAFLKKKGFYRS